MKQQLNEVQKLQKLAGILKENDSIGKTPADINLAKTKYTRPELAKLKTIRKSLDGFSYLKIKGDNYEVWYSPSGMDFDYNISVYDPIDDQWYPNWYYFEDENNNPEY